MSASRHHRLGQNSRQKTRAHRAEWREWVCKRSGSVDQGVRHDARRMASPAS